MVDEVYLRPLFVTNSIFPFLLYELAALIARVIMMARKGTVGANEYGADPVRIIG